MPNAPDNRTRNVRQSRRKKTYASNEKQQARIEQNNHPKQWRRKKNYRVTLRWWMNEWMYELNDLTPSCWRAAIGRAKIVVFHLFSSCRNCVQSREKYNLKKKKKKKKECVNRKTKNVDTIQLSSVQLDVVLPIFFLYFFLSDSEIVGIPLFAQNDWIPSEKCSLHGLKPIGGDNCA